MKISVVIPVYNAEKYVEKAVESALQFDDVCEVILVEDKSPDNALKVCQMLEQKYERVKLHQHPDKENHGASASRNLGIEKTTGEFISFLDADDYFLPNRFDAEKELFKDRKVEGVYGALGVHYLSEKAKEQHYSFFGDRLTTVNKRHDPKDVFSGLIYLKGSFGQFSLDTLTVRKSSLQKMETLFKDSLRLHEDTEFLLRLSYYLNLYPGIIDKAIAARGIHEENRITKVNTKKINPSVTRAIFWKETNHWAQNEETIPQNIKTHIRRIERSFIIANAPKLKKWGMIVKYLFTDYISIRSGLYNINFRHTIL
jgi:glycosyltransferase involved in cell wall biosynthesis